jgi:hypothetical protein
MANSTCLKVLLFIGCIVGSAPVFAVERVALVFGNGRFCCKSRLRPGAKRDSVVLTRFSARSIHDGPSEE